uniref:Reverse transcriptase/retrotransposon-derived protein RNase H-like domain-containing protein n=1 Tax=Hyaloperonospora arabidopsidis (strain Emoy2) TaxID=559515 RepID=M4BGF5_HYAAE
MNYYSRFIQDFAMYASFLYELGEADFHEIRRSHNMKNDCSSSHDHVCSAQICDDRGQWPAGDHDHQLVTINDQDEFKVKESDGEHTGDHRWEKAIIAFTMLKAKVARTPVLRHFDPDRRSVIVAYASKWAVSAALLQEHDGVNVLLCSQVER